MMADIEKVVKARHSSRKFLSDPVPRAVLDEALELAQLAPSNSNIQPWFVVIAQGGRRDRLREVLLKEAQATPPPIPSLPDAFKHFRQEAGAKIYGAMGIAREDKEGRRAAVLRNYEFFGAPAVAIICMHRDLGVADSLGVGMWLQTFVLALTARGLATCCQVSLAAYPDVLRAELNIPAELSIICGVAIGYEDPTFPANSLHIGRAALQNNVVILDS